MDEIQINQVEEPLDKNVRPRRSDTTTTTSAQVATTTTIKDDNHKQQRVIARTTTTTTTTTTMTDTDDDNDDSGKARPMNRLGQGIIVRRKLTNRVMDKMSKGIGNHHSKK